MQSPATGKTRSGRARISATLSISLRMTLIGQTPSPLDSAQLHRECRIDARVEEAFERGVVDRLAAQFSDTIKPPCVAKKYEEDRRIADPRHAREQRADRGPLLGIAQTQNRRLLKVRLG